MHAQASALKAMVLQLILSQVAAVMSALGGTFMG